MHLAAKLKKDARHVSEMLLKSGADVNAATEVSMKRKCRNTLMHQGKRSEIFVG